MILDTTPNASTIRVGLPEAANLIHRVIQKGAMINRRLANTGLTRVQALIGLATFEADAPPTLSLSRCFVLWRNDGV